jgi:hypothetical protein
LSCIPPSLSRRFHSSPQPPAAVCLYARCYIQSSHLIHIMQTTISSMLRYSHRDIMFAVCTKAAAKCILQHHSAISCGTSSPNDYSHSSYTLKISIRILGVVVVVQFCVKINFILMFQICQITFCRRLRTYHSFPLCGWHWISSTETATAISRSACPLPH